MGPPSFVNPVKSTSPDTSHPFKYSLDIAGDPSATEDGNKTVCKFEQLNQLKLPPKCVNPEQSNAVILVELNPLKEVKLPDASSGNIRVCVDGADCIIRPVSWGALTGG